jgi:hypothetical protein
MSLDERLTRAAHQVADHVTVPEVDLDAVRSGARVRTRRRTLSVAAAGVMLVAVVGTAVAMGRDAERTLPADPPRIGPAPHVAVWYDDAGLHHGDQVDDVPVELYSEGSHDTRKGAGSVLALVRNGAVYVDPVEGDVWFHPWDGDPRIISRGDAKPEVCAGCDYGPGGDPDGDLAVWFEGDELVVYDTATGSEVSRTTEEPVSRFAGTEHVLNGNGFMHVSDDEVVWRFERWEGKPDGLGTGVYRLDLATGESGLLESFPYLEEAGPAPQIEDVDGETRIVVTRKASGSIAVERSSGPRMPIEGAEPIGRFSPDGAFVVTPTGGTGDDHGIAVIDVRTGARWDLLDKKFYGYLSWSYDDIAVVKVDLDGGTTSYLLACEAAARTCERHDVQGDVVLPTP